MGTTPGQHHICTLLALHGAHAQLSGFSHIKPIECSISNPIITLALSTILSASEPSQVHEAMYVGGQGCGRTHSWSSSSWWTLEEVYWWGCHVAMDILPVQSSAVPFKCVFHQARKLILSNASTSPQAWWRSCKSLSFCSRQSNSILMMAGLLKNLMRFWSLMFLLALSVSCLQLVKLRSWPNFCVKESPRMTRNMYYSFITYISVSSAPESLQYQPDKHVDPNQTVHGMLTYVIHLNIPQHTLKWNLADLKVTSPHIAATLPVMQNYW